MTHNNLYGNKNEKMDFETIKSLLLKSIENGFEAELTLYINDKAYMIIIYDNYCSFQRCGWNDGSGEYIFNSLDELYKATQVDNIILERDWDKIQEFESFDFEVQNLWH